MKSAFECFDTIVAARNGSNLDFLLFKDEPNRVSYPLFVVDEKYGCGHRKAQDSGELEGHWNSTIIAWGNRAEKRGFMGLC